MNDDQYTRGYWLSLVGFVLLLILYANGGLPWLWGWLF